MIFPTDYLVVCQLKILLGEPCKPASFEGHGWKLKLVGTITLPETNPAGARPQKETIVFQRPHFSGVNSLLVSGRGI